MAIIVQKFGGTSVADAEKIRRAARRVIERKQAGYQVVVVASAGNSGNKASNRSQAHAPYSYPADYPGVLGQSHVGLPWRAGHGDRDGRQH